MANEDKLRVNIPNPDKDSTQARVVAVVDTEYPGVATTADGKTVQIADPFGNIKNDVIVFDDKNPVKRK